MMTIDSIQKQALFFILDQLEKRQMKLERASHIAQMILSITKNASEKSDEQMLHEIQAIPELKDLHH